MNVVIREIAQSSSDFDEVLLVATALDQAKYITRTSDHWDRSILLGAFNRDRCVGFLRFFIQIIGSDEERPPIYMKGKPLSEGFVEAFGVLPDCRRKGIGQRLQERAIEMCEREGCYQIRSRSPVTSRENYQLKLKTGYTIHPSNENDSYYFIKKLNDDT